VQYQRQLTHTTCRRFHDEPISKQRPSFHNQPRVLAQRNSCLPSSWLVRASCCRHVNNEAAKRARARKYKTHSFVGAFWFYVVKVSESERVKVVNNYKTYKRGSAPHQTAHWAGSTSPSRVLCMSHNSTGRAGRVKSIILGAPCRGLCMGVSLPLFFWVFFFFPVRSGWRGVVGGEALRARGRPSVGSDSTTP
jgi:hypothetical protein